jgi:hypothetical protein
MQWISSRKNGLARRHTSPSGYHTFNTIFAMRRAGQYRQAMSLFVHGHLRPTDIRFWKAALGLVLPKKLLP